MELKRLFHGLTPSITGSLILANLDIDILSGFLEFRDLPVLIFEDQPVEHRLQLDLLLDPLLLLDVPPLLPGDAELKIETGNEISGRIRNREMLFQGLRKI